MGEVVIEVRIADRRFEENEVLKGQLILNTLRAAGIPAVGALFLRGVERGKITLFFDELFDEHVWQWDENNTCVA